MEVYIGLSCFGHIFLILMVVTQDCFGCTQKNFPNTLPEKIVSSNVIIWGRIVSKTVDHQRSRGTAVAYSAEVRVNCVLKGRVHSRIIVDDVGNVAGKCLDVDFIENEEYIMMLRVDRQGRYIPTFQQDVYSAAQLNRIYTYCGINISQPLEEAQKESSYVDCQGMINPRSMRKKSSRCLSLERVQKWRDKGSQLPPSTTPVFIPARTRELDRPTRRPNRRKYKNRQSDDSRGSENSGMGSTDQQTNSRRYPTQPTQGFVAIIYERREPRSGATSFGTTLSLAVFLSTVTSLLYNNSNI